MRVIVTFAEAADECREEQSAAGDNRRLFPSVPGRIRLIRDPLRSDIHWRVFEQPTRCGTIGHVTKTCLCNSAPSGIMHIPKSYGPSQVLLKSASGIG